MSGENIYSQFQYCFYDSNVFSREIFNFRTHSIVFASDWYFCHRKKNSFKPKCFFVRFHLETDCFSGALSTFLMNNVEHALYWNHGNATAIVFFIYSIGFNVKLRLAICDW